MSAIRGIPAHCAAALLLALLPLGCRSAAPMHVDGAYQPMPPNGLDFGKYNQTPRPRMGGLPYPGAFTLFALANPQHLGHHSYDNQLGGSEADRGILYTCRGGFIDIAHARKSIDLCKHVAVRAEFALMNDWTAFQVKALEPSVYTIRLEYPPFWKSLSPDEKKALAHELSIRIAERMAMLVLTWHEMLTYFGYQSTPLISEKQSAFTWDDTGAHAFGVMVADHALRDRRDWDDAVTDAINAGLADLGVVTPDECMAAIERIRDVWWSGFEPLKRQIELGWTGEPVQAWLVPDLPFCKDSPPTPHRYYLPKLDDVLGRDFSGLIHVGIQPNVLNTEQIRSVLPNRPQVIDVDKDLPILFDYVRKQVARDEGPQALRPD